MQLTKDQRFFIILEFKAIKSCEEVRRASNEKLPERNLPIRKRFNGLKIYQFELEV